MGRRAWLLVAGALAVALVVGVVVGAVGSGLPSVAPPPAGSRAALPSATADAEAVIPVSVDVTAAGVLWRTTVGTDCGGCVVVWRRGPDDAGWTGVRRVGGDGRPDRIRMADDGIHGLIGGEGLWVTRDGAQNWVRDDAPPFRGDVSTSVAVVGDLAWVLVRRPVGDSVLLVRPTGGTLWRPVSPRSVDGVVRLGALGGDVLVWGRTGEGRRTLMRSTDGGRSWTSVSSCRVAGQYAAGAGLAVTTCGTAGGHPRVADANGVAVHPDGHAYTVAGQTLLVSDDRGRSWAPLD